MSLLVFWFSFGFLSQGSLRTLRTLRSVGVCLLVMSVQVDDLCREVFLHPVLAIGSTDAALLLSGMESLHGLEVLAVDIHLSELQFS